MNHQAIYNTHPDVVSIDDGKGATDASGNPVVLDQSLVDAEASRLEIEQATAVAQKAADKASATAKLGALGLSSAEIEALKS